MDERSAAYDEALDKAREESEAFAEAQRAYRAREIGDDEFLTALERHERSQRDFDAAYAAEEARGE